VEVEWEEICQEPKVEMIVLLYHKTDILGLQAFLRDKFNLWTGNGSCIEEIWKNFKNIIFEGIKRYVPQKIWNKNPDPEYYNEEVKWLKIKVRRVYNKREFGQPYQVELKHLSKELLVAKKKSQEIFLRSVLRNEGSCWTELC